MLSNWLGISQVMILKYQAVVEFFKRSPSNLLNTQRLNLRKPFMNRRLIYFNFLWLFSTNEWIVGHNSSGRKLDISSSFQFEQEPSAYHIAQSAIRLNPIPGFAEFF